MRKTMFCAVILTAAGLAGCGYTPEQRATSGAALGAGTGAIIASAAGASPGGIIASSLLGAGAGGLIGATTRPPPPYPPPPRAAYLEPPPPGARCVDFREDMYGRRYCYAYY